MRTLPALLVAAGLVASLAACSSSAQAPKPAITAGDASSLVTVTGALFAKPTADFPTPLISTGDQVSTLVTGKGEILAKGDIAEFQASVYDGKSGELLTQTSYAAATPSFVTVGASAPGFSKALTGVAVGSRVAETTKASNVFSSFGDTLTANDTVVLVLDVQDGFPGRATGADQVPQRGLPTVVTAPNGNPGITLHSTTPPTTLEYTTLKAGDGGVVKAGDNLLVQYLEIDWAGKTILNNTWTTSPAGFSVTPYDATTQIGLPKGLVTALTGAKVGSQVLAVIPPSSGYATGSVPAGISATSTLVYVVDILKIEK